MVNLSISNFKVFIIKAIYKTILVLLLFAVALEFYNPLSKKQNSTIVFKNEIIPELPNKITVKFNNLGYMGEDFSDTITRQKICFLGSSRTQLIYIPFSLQWTYRAITEKSRYWINNCGKGGHRINDLINDVKKLSKIKPNYIIVLIDPFDKTQDFKKGEFKAIENFQFLSSIIKPFYRIIKSKVNGYKIGHTKVDWRNEKLRSSNKINSIKIENKEIEYKLDELSNIINNLNAVPIFISCPTTYGNYKSADGINMGAIENSIEIDEFHYQFSIALNDYCKKKKIYFIDGYRFKKDSRFFYDYHHFSIVGSINFAELIRPKLNLILNSRDSSITMK